MEVKPPKPKRRLKTKLFQQSLNRISTGLDPKSSSMTNFIVKSTYINLRKYSFKGHEFQEYISLLVENNIRNLDISVEKCSQIGLTEVFYRIMLALMAVIPGFSTLYAAQSTKFATENIKTRVSSIIDQSPDLARLINRKVDSTQVKQFINGAILFAVGAGATSKGALVSRPIDFALVDELDKCDIKTATGFRSRQTHSKFKALGYISTPTARGFGINKFADNRQVHRQHIICHSCHEEYLPDFYEQVKLPGFDRPVSELTKRIVANMSLDKSKAFHHCPYCNIPSTGKLGPEHRIWRIENPHLDEIHVKLTPFDAPSFIPPGDLITSIIKYGSKAEFDNQALGLTAALNDTQMKTDLIKFTNQEVPSGTRVSGQDFGKSSYQLEAVVLDNDVLFVDVPRIVSLLDANLDLRENTKNTFGQRKVSNMVGDSIPFLDHTYAMTRKYYNYIGAYYVTPKNPESELYKVKEPNEVGVAEGKIRQLMINKNLMMDHIVGLIKEEKIIFKHSEYDEELKEHLTDMQRIKDPQYDKQGQTRYIWIKGSGNDHLWHALVYLVCAHKMLGTHAFNNAFLFSTGALVRKMKLTGSPY